MAIDRVKASAILDGAIDTDDLASGAVTSAKLDTNIAIAGNLTVDTNTLHVDSANNRVGVGITSPTTALDVVGTIAADGLTVTQTGSTTATIGATGTSGDNDGTLIINNGGTGDGMLRFDYETNTDRARIGVTASTQDLIFYTAGSEKARILSAGGITFNGDTAAANALDDYEEGTWTPTLSLGAGSLTYSQQNGSYTKIGNIVYISLLVSGTNTTNAFLNNLTSLPFTVGGYSGFYPGPTVSNAYFVNLGTGGTVLGGYWVNGSASLKFHSYGNNTNQLGPVVTGGQAFEIRMQGFYTVS